jgi:putative Mg2+ transporter-C (MgtC) family protein
VIVALGACLATIVSEFYFPTEQTRILQGIITGIGFLGAGAILWSKNSVHGLTTAATIWTTAILGLAVGSGAYMLSIVFTCIVMIFLRIKRIERKL